MEEGKVVDAGRLHHQNAASNTSRFVLGSVLATNPRNILCALFSSSWDDLIYYRNNNNNKAETAVIMVVGMVLLCTKLHRNRTCCTIHTSKASSIS